MPSTTFKLAQFSILSGGKGGGTVTIHVYPINVTVTGQGGGNADGFVNTAFSTDLLGGGTGLTATVFGSGSDQIVNFTFSGTDQVTLTAGTEYGFEVDSPAAGNFSWERDGGGNFSTGNIYQAASGTQKNGVGAASDRDGYFAIYAVAVPEPTSLAALSLGGVACSSVVVALERSRTRSDSIRQRAKSTPMMARLRPRAFDETVNEPAGAPVRPVQHAHSIHAKAPMPASFISSRQAAAALAIAIAMAVGAARADTTVTGSTLALRSSGTVSGSTVTLNQNGYLGTYVRLDAPGAITLSAIANGAASNGVNPDLTFSIADVAKTFVVTPGSTSAYAYTSPTLPAGTYFVRAQLDNHETVRVNNAPVVANTTLSLASLTLGANATVLNAATDANARSAADTYIENFRKGNATVRLAGATPGAAVHVQLRNNAFKLGTYVSGFNSSDSYLRANPTAGSDAAQFQSFIDGRFNAIVPSNAGKWSSTETIALNGSGAVSSQFQTMGTVDQMMAYAKAHGLTARQHNLIWGNQQAAAVQTWVTDAASGSATAANSLAKLNSAITNRINYYVKSANTLTGQPRAQAFAQLDVLNEALQTGPYFKALGYSGIASVYKQTQDAVAAAGAATRLYTNEYNVLQNAPITVTPSASYGGQAAATYGDAYANWYRQEIEGINNAGAIAGAAGDVVTGVGVQYYPTANGTRGPNVIQGALQNLSVTGLPISLTEFGGQTSIAEGDAPLLVDDTIRMMMGTPAVDSMLMWGWYDQDAANTDNFGDGTTLVNKGWKNADGSYNLTAAGVRFEYLFGRGLDPSAPGANADGSNPNPWTTDLTTSVSADGTVDLHGFYGDYDVTIGGKVYALTLEKGVASYALQVPEPTTAASLAAVAFFARRQRFRGRCVKMTFFD